MAATVTVRKMWDAGGYQMAVADVTFDSSYANGGEAIVGGNASNGFRFRAGDLFHVQVDPVAGHVIRFVANADGRQGTLKVFREALRNCALSSAGLAISGSKKKVLIGNTVTYLSGGLFKSKTTAEVGFTATTHDIAADASTVQEAVYAVSLQADGTPIITMGAIATGAGAAVRPQTPLGETLIGYVRVAVAAGATSFDATSDDLDAAHLTVTYTNAALPPDSYVGGASPDRMQEVATATDLSSLTVRVLAHGR